MTQREFKPSELAARVDAIEARLQAVEVRSVLSLPIAVVSPEPQTKKSPPPPDGKPLADGIQWLLTNEAWKLAQRRGCEQDYASFAKHAKAHPDRLDTWGLRFLGSNKPGDHRTASFQDLLWIQ